MVMGNAGFRKPRTRGPGEFASLAERRLVLPLTVFALDLTLYGLAVFGAVASTSLPIKFALSLLAGIAVLLLGIVAHDAVHRSFTSSRFLNRVIGTVAFLPALHPYSRWEYHHNRIHHHFTAQLGIDNAYPPMTVDDYARASRLTRRIYRWKRSLAGQAFYYLFDIWLPKMFLPARREREDFRASDWIDVLMVQGWLLIFVTMLTLWLHLETHRSWTGALLDAAAFGFLVPFLVWNVFISLVTVVQHTGPDVRWITARGRPSTPSETMRGTVHLVLPEPVDWFFHRVMQHPAHHVHSGIPLYALKKAEIQLESRWVDPPTKARWTPRYHWRLTSDCKLYDPERIAWCNFALETTSPAA
jgi:omega-6 fatty acid desaturase (delta-12 desaturase)